jgi:hypothetical protein
MAPIIEVSDEDLNAFNQLGIKYTLRSKPSKAPKVSSDFIYVPSIGLDVSTEKIGLGENWYEGHKAVQGSEGKMLTIPEFREFLKYSRENYPKLYEEVTAVRTPWRAEHLDADFKLKDGKLYINSGHVLDSRGNLVPQHSEVLHKDTLMKDRTPGISLDDWVDGKNVTSQGLPNSKSSKGDLYYWYPRDDNNSVARFVADDDRTDFICNWDPSYWDSNLGVRVAKQHK